MAKVLVLYYGAYGHIETLAQAEVEGARSVPGTEVTLKRVKELFTAEEAKEYGLVDDVLTMVKRRPDVVSS